MDVEKIKRRGPKAARKININVKVTEDISNWLRIKGYSPTAIFYEALKDLGYKPSTEAEKIKEHLEGQNKEIRQHEANENQAQGQQY